MPIEAILAHSEGLLVEPEAVVRRHDQDDSGLIRKNGGRPEIEPPEVVQGQIRHRVTRMHDHSERAAALGRDGSLPTHEGDDDRRHNEASHDPGSQDAPEKPVTIRRSMFQPPKP